MLVGNKCDLQSDRVILKEKAQSLAQSWGAGFMETSARKRLNVDQVFMELVRQIQKQKKLVPMKKRSFCNLM